MNLTNFLAALDALETSIETDSPVSLSVVRTYWGAPAEALPDLPCIINAMTESDRTLGFGGREQRFNINVQLFAAKANVEDTQSALIATAFWFAAKDVFDRDTSIGGTVDWSTLQGLDPTVPVILTHAGYSYIGFSAMLQVQDVHAFTF